MKFAIRANESMKNELLAQGLNQSPEIEWVDGDTETERERETGTQSPTLSLSVSHSAFIDLLFQPNKTSIDEYSAFGDRIVIVNAVSVIARELPDNFVRINAWPTFLQRPIVEAACTNAMLRDKAENILKCFNKKIEWVPDIPGFISARVISMIINEAYFALQENVSTREEIDIAMKLGTNYPYGPFEWSRKIGLSSIHELLTMLARNIPRYAPASLMSKEVMQA